MFIELDRNSRRPMYLQIVSAITDAVTRGTLRSGDRLPSSRALSATLGVSRNTVLCAYDQLASHGVVAGSHGSATRVTGRRAAPVDVLAESQFAVRSVAFADPDGNSLRLFFRGTCVRELP